MTPEPLEFPHGIRFPREDELPDDAKTEMARIEAANVTTGYLVGAAIGQHFKTYIEANVHASKVFDTFRKLVVALLPEVASPLIGLKGEKPAFGPYTDREYALAVFEPYLEPLQHDGFLEFGILHQSDFAFEEVFVTSEKYFKIWTNNGSVAEGILEQAGIPKCETLEFIDNYFLVSESLTPDGTAAWPNAFYPLKAEIERLTEISIIDDGTKPHNVMV